MFSSINQKYYKIEAKKFWLLCLLRETRVLFSKYIYILTFGQFSPFSVKVLNVSFRSYDNNRVKL